MCLILAASLVLLSATCGARALAVADGAAFDPVTGRWRLTAWAPVPIHPAASAVVSG